MYSLNNQTTIVRPVNHQRFLRIVILLTGRGSQFSDLRVPSRYPKSENWEPPMGTLVVPWKKAKDETFNDTDETFY